VHQIATAPVLVVPANPGARFVQAAFEHGANKSSGGSVGHAQASAHECPPNLKFLLSTASCNMITSGGDVKKE
jgi:hypothetical protein